MRLLPDGESFKACYSPWLEYVASLIVRSDEGTSFGIFGPWGSGKSSACTALAKQIHAAAADARKIFQCVTVDAFRLSTLSPGRQEEELLTLLRREILFEEAPHPPTGRRTAYRFIKNIISPLFAAGGQPAAAAALGVLASAADEEAGHRGLASSIPDSPELDRIVLLLDDLDRCDPREAIAVMASISGVAAYDKTNVIIACDPDVLAAHVAATCGISKTSGRDVLSKYVHVPLGLPMGRSPNHGKALTQALVAANCSDLLREAALDSIGFVPIREILGAVPQAQLWLEALQRIASNPQVVAQLAPVCLFLAIVGNVVPVALRVASGSLKGMLALRHIFLPDSRERAFPFLGQESEDVLRGRTDLLQLGDRVLSSAKEDHFQVLISMLATQGAAPEGRQRAEEDPSR